MEGNLIRRKRRGEWGWIEEKREGGIKARNNDATKESTKVESQGSLHHQPLN